MILAMYWCFYMLNQHVLSMEALILGFQFQNSASIVAFYELWSLQQRGVWSIEKNQGFFDMHLMGSYTKAMFKEKAKVSHATFQYLYEELCLFLMKKDTRFRSVVSVERRVAISLVRLGSGNGLQIIGDLFGVAECTVSQIVREFYSLVRIHLPKKIVTFPSEHRFCQMAREFEALHDIPYVVGATNGSHIPILTPVNGGEDYYYCKSFHFALL